MEISREGRSRERTVRKRWLAVALASVALVAVGAGCGDDEDDGGGGGGGDGGGSTSSGGGAADSQVDQLKVGELNVDVSKYCGDKPFKVGIIDGFGGNTWRVETRELITQEAEKCPNNEGVEYFDANLDPQKFNSTLNSWAAQGVNIVVAFNDFGQSVVPAFRAAQRAGIKVTTQNALPGSDVSVPDDVTAAVVPNFDLGAKAWIDFLAEAIPGGKGNIVFIGGPPGNLFDPAAMDAVKKALEAEPGLKLLEDNFVVGNWDPGVTQKATAALLNKYDKIDGVILSYNATGPAVVRAFKAAGKPLPAIVGQSSSNEFVCLVEEERKKNPDFHVQGLDASGNQAPIALAKGLAAFQGIDAPELGPTDAFTESNYAKYIDTLSDNIPECDPSLPPGADLSHALSKEEISTLLAE